MIQNVLYLSVFSKKVVELFILTIKLFSKLFIVRTIANKVNCFDGDNSYIVNDVPVPRSVNYHFTRKCNYSCGFCFHTAKTSFILDLSVVKRGLKMLKDAGMEKINFSGGEPFLPSRGKHLGEMVKFCKDELKLPSVTVVTNGSLIRECWFKQYGQYLDIMAVSCDSFFEDTNKEIGRSQGKKSHIEQLYRIRNWCKMYNVLFKINTVVNTYNADEDMSTQITELNPIRWKVFQCLLLDGENVGPEALRNGERFYITNEAFDCFLERHKHVKCLVPESNVNMQNSYLILDEYMRFLDCREGSKKPSKSILDVGVSNALQLQDLMKLHLRREVEFISGLKQTIIYLGRF